MKDETNLKHKNNHADEVKAYQELNNEIANNDSLKNRQPTPQPKEYDEIEY